MNRVIHLQSIDESNRELVGGKCFALAAMTRSGLNVPEAVCLSALAYREYIRSTGLDERILLELNRKDFSEMRWEEIWDASLRIRNMFLTTPLPPDLDERIRSVVKAEFQDRAVAVRSSALGEDSARASFAGLHESYVNIRGTADILEHVRKVWASLWSDAALLYRQELGLDVESGAMAVLIQEMVMGDRSGVIFGQDPIDETRAVVESVYGLNQGLVDGAVEPDRWIVDRNSGKIITHVAARRNRAAVPVPGGTRLEALGRTKSKRPPLKRAEVVRVFELALRAEELFGAAQDVEWTFRRKTLHALQSRSITTMPGSQNGDNRSWYLSLKRSFENLQALRRQIEDDLIPALVKEASELAARDLAGLSDHELANEIERRKTLHDKWIKVYWRDFIPFAHGVRLFGQIYNDALRPSDPYELMDLLGATQMVSLRRNRKLEEMASLIRKSQPLRDALKVGDSPDAEPEFTRKMEAFIKRFGDLSCAAGQGSQGRDSIYRILLEMASGPPLEIAPKGKDSAVLREEFFDHFEGEERARAVEILDLARTSYRLRDDDNIYVGRIEAQLAAAVVEGKKRIKERCPAGIDRLDEREVIAALQDRSYVPEPREKGEKESADFSLKPRQLTGQPAGPGIAGGTARVLNQPDDLSDFKAGEILICDAIDPNMTFVVPLSAAIVERRGGMLIHGAIIAREYGLPCVTGVPDVTSLIRTGDTVTVDGYLGIVIVG